MSELAFKLSTTPWRCNGKWRCNSTHYFTSPLDGGEWSASLPDRFTHRERAPVTHWTGSWLGTRTGMDMVSKRKIPNRALILHNYITLVTTDPVCWSCQFGYPLISLQYLTVSDCVVVANSR